MTVRKRMSFRPSLQDTKRANLAAMESMAHGGMSDAGRKNLEEMRLTVKPKQVRKPSQPSLIPLERDVNREITSAAKQFDNVKLWRNNRGQVILPNGGRLTYGVGPNGASDFIGYTRLTITQDMVGCIVAQFTAVESKRPGERATDEQAEFIERVEQDGGWAGVAHSGEEAVAILRRK